MGLRRFQRWLSDTNILMIPNKHFRKEVDVAKTVWTPMYRLSTVHGGANAQPVISWLFQVFINTHHPLNEMNPSCFHCHLTFNLLSNGSSFGRLYPHPRPLVGTLTKTCCCGFQFIIICVVVYTFICGATPLSSATRAISLPNVAKCCNVVESIWISHGYNAKDGVTCINARWTFSLRNVCSRACKSESNVRFIYSLSISSSIFY